MLSMKKGMPVALHSSPSNQLSQSLDTGTLGSEHTNRSVSDMHAQEILGARKHSYQGGDPPCLIVSTAREQCSRAIITVQKPRTRESCSQTHITKRTGAIQDEQKQRTSTKRERDLERETFKRTERERGGGVDVRKTHFALSAAGFWQYSTQEVLATTQLLGSKHHSTNPALSCTQAEEALLS